ncbi:hypothetical protein [Brachyspira murdochii]|uniref:Uncharacterized protein n=2 Tax=Brachyspira murdochii TaxID=84378 RepID=D5U9B0_BRAM5|nr:hypothetical protein [Brachyspira murdochii]ADG71283.1 conserved hypothetical protein [Brachyspira murdochii DSM 12563]PPS21169.1 hypothetical protein DJ52_12115 [Brachyspira murdochii]
MTVNKINNAQSLQQIQANPQKSDAAPQNAVNTQKLSQQMSGISPLSSRYTYAIGQDGKRYILQLRIDISSVRAFSSLA